MGLYKNVFSIFDGCRLSDTDFIKEGNKLILKHGFVFDRYKVEPEINSGNLFIDNYYSDDDPIWNLPTYPFDTLGEQVENLHSDEFGLGDLGNDWF